MGEIETLRFIRAAYGEMIRESCGGLDIKNEWDGSENTRFWVDLTEPLSAHRRHEAEVATHIAEGI